MMSKIEGCKSARICGMEYFSLVDYAYTVIWYIWLIYRQYIGHLIVVDVISFWFWFVSCCRARTCSTFRVGWRSLVSWTRWLTSATHRSFNMKFPFPTTDWSTSPLPTAQTIYMALSMLPTMRWSFDARIWSTTSILWEVLWLSWRSPECWTRTVSCRILLFLYQRHWQTFLSLQTWHSSLQPATEATCILRFGRGTFLDRSTTQEFIACWFTRQETAATPTVSHRTVLQLWWPTSMPSSLIYPAGTRNQIQSRQQTHYAGGTWFIRGDLAEVTSVHHSYITPWWGDEPIWTFGWNGIQWWTGVNAAHDMSVYCHFSDNAVWMLL